MKYLEQELSDRKAELQGREYAVTKREKDMAALQEEVDSFPQGLDDKVQAAVKETTERLTNDFEKSKSLLETQFEGEKNVLSSKIESLQNLVKAQETQIADLSRRNEQAYEKVQKGYCQPCCCVCKAGIHFRSYGLSGNPGSTGKAEHLALALG